MRRDPESFEEFIREAADGSPVETVYIDGQTLMQSGLAEKVAEVSPSVAAQLEEAAANGGTIAIPVEEYATRIAPAEFAQNLIEDLRVEPDGFSQREAQEYIANSGEELSALVEQNAKTAEEVEAKRASANVVRDNIKAQLEATGRFRPAVNDAYATLVGNAYLSFAERIGMTPEALYERYPLKIDTGHDAEAFDQALASAPPKGWAHIETPEEVLPLWEGTTDAQAVFWTDLHGKLSQDAPELAGYSHSLDQSTANHIRNEHGDAGTETPRGQIAVTGNDVARIPEIVTQYDAMRPVKGRNGQTLVAYAKRFDDGVTVYFEVISGRKRNMAGVSMRRYFTSSNADTILERAVRDELNVQNERNISPQENDSTSGEELNQSDYTNVSDMLGRAFNAMGLEYRQESSKISNSRYVIVDSPELTQSNGEHGDQIKIRISDHMLPIHRYEQPDFDVFRDVRHEGELVNNTGDWMEAVEFVAQRFGVKAAPIVKQTRARMETNRKKQEAKARERGRSLAQQRADNFTRIMQRFEAEAEDSEAVNNAYENGIDRNGEPVSGRKYIGGDLFGGLSKNTRRYLREKFGLPVESTRKQYVLAEIRQKLEEATAEKEYNQSAYHGSPYRFDRFTLEHLGSGEGNQAFGWGLYFAGDRALAEHYRKSLSLRRNRNNRLLVDGERVKLGTNGIWTGETSGKVYTPLEEGNAVTIALEALWGRSGDRQAAIDRLSRQAENSQLPNYEAASREAIRLIEDGRVEYRQDEGQLYEVDIPEDSDLLDYDKPLAEQSEKVKAAIQSEIDALVSKEDQEQFKRTGGRLNKASTAPLRWTGEIFYGNLSRRLGSDRAASEFLNSLGIPGLRYLDGNSRAKGEGTHNYVIWDEAAVNVLETYYQRRNQDARGSFNPETLTIRLLQAADPSTFLHEAGHFFLEMQTDLVGQLTQETAAFGVENLSNGERQMIADTDTLMRWFGLRDLSEWVSLPFEERRAYHEQFARGFEAYLFEGKAPSLEMAGLFSRFRQWLLRVYQSITSLNVKLDDSVRGVFDRMLAADEQIALAKQARSLMPLFETPEQSGMTPEEFAAYQALGKQATEEAVAYLESKGLRDLRWIHNARGREIARLKKLAYAQRKEVELEVRREIMSQPVYRAWQFLTSKLVLEDQLPKTPKHKSDPNVVDETRDSLFTAIAKLGGLSREEAISTWGIDPADKPQSGVFGKPVWRNKGGLSLDSMSEALASLGYLTLDENGRYDINELFEKFNAQLSGDEQYSSVHDLTAALDERRPPAERVKNPGAIEAGRLDLQGLRDMYGDGPVVAVLEARGMTATEGWPADMVAELLGGQFDSGDAMIQAIIAAKDPKTAIAELTDQVMMEQHGELATPEAIEEAANAAILNDVMARVVATEENALAKATGKRGILVAAAREYAANVIGRLRLRDIKPGLYQQAQAKAAKAAAKAQKKGDIARAAVEKRNQLVQIELARAAQGAKDYVTRNIRYLRRMAGDAKGIDPGYRDQIHQILERFELKATSDKTLDRRAALAVWLKEQEEAGIAPDISPKLVEEARRMSYKDLSMEEFRGLVDSVRQIEHMGRFKNRLLTAARNRDFKAVEAEILTSLLEHARGRQAITRTPNDATGRGKQAARRAMAAHLKAATIANILDGGIEGGPVWEYLIRPANACGDRETEMIAVATQTLTTLLKPWTDTRLRRKTYFPSIDRSLNREEVLAIALNLGNAGNQQRLLDGEHWRMAQLEPILSTITAEQWGAVQAIWDFMGSYRPLIAAKERRVYGKEPEWVEPVPLTVTTSEGQTLTLSGGYFPIRYDPYASGRASEQQEAEDIRDQLKGAYTSTTTRRSFTKTRANKVMDRPILLSLQGIYGGVDEVIHDLAWHEWLIDANKLLKPGGNIGTAIRETYGAETLDALREWTRDIAVGNRATQGALERTLARIRQGVSASGLGFNVWSALQQPFGYISSIVTIGKPWAARGLAEYLAHPIELTRRVNAMSSFMANRGRTRFRELNELRNEIRGQTVFTKVAGQYGFVMLLKMQQTVDVPTWWGAYEKALNAGHDEAKAIALADQAVIDSQGSGMTKDRSEIERVGWAKIFTVYYTFMNTQVNLSYRTAMTEKSRGKMAAKLLMINTLSPMLVLALKEAMFPDDGGEALR